LKAKKEKPRVRFCWYCGRKLYGNSFVEKEIDRHVRILHKGCSTEAGRKHVARDDQLLDEGIQKPKCK